MHILATSWSTVSHTQIKTLTRQAICSDSPIHVLSTQLAMVSEDLALSNGAEIGVDKAPSFLAAPSSPAGGGAAPGST